MKSHRVPYKIERARGKWRSFSPFALYFLLFFVVFSFGCRRKAPSEPDANAPGQADAVKTTTSDDIAVTVNGNKIMEAEIDEIVNSRLASLMEHAPNKSPEFIKQYRALFRKQALEVAIARQLLDKEMKGADITVTEEDIINWLKATAAAQKPPLSLEEFKKRMAARGQTFDQMKEQVRQGLVYEKFMKRQWAGKISVTEEDANDYYSKNKDRYEQVSARHILIEPDPSDPNTDPNEAKATAKAELQDLLKKIKDGADFAELAKAHSDCPSAAKGGDLGFFKRGAMTPPFEEVAFELEVGQVSDIVETKFGYHIIKATDRKDSFEQFKDEIIAALIQKKQREFAGEYIKSLKAEADIVYPPGSGDKLPVAENETPAK